MSRIAIGSILTECNQLGGIPIDITWFERYDLHRGEAVLKVRSGVVGGMLEVLRERQADVVPLLTASTCPGAYLTAACYTALKTELLDRLRAALPVDGVLLPLHGAAVAENAPDLEGDLIRAVRQVVGPSNARSLKQKRSDPPSNTKWPHRRPRALQRSTFWL